MTKDERVQKVWDLKENWAELFKQLGLETSKAYYYPKPVMKRGNEPPYITVFPKELARTDDFFTEPVDFDCIPETKRKLYRLKPNPFYESAYTLVSTPIGEQYKVPFSELNEVVLEAPKPVTPKNIFTEPQEDCHVDQLTGRDWACIHLKTPMSDKSWLNEVIRTVI